jgi:hypothetical protein
MKLRSFIASLLAVIGIGSTQAQTGLDFSHVTSREKAEQLASEGKLFKILLFPAQFGGKDIPHNTVYVPPGIPEIKAKLDGTLVRYTEEGLINKLKVEPAYKGNSFVPSKIAIKASHSEKQGSFNPTIEIW